MVAMLDGWGGVKLLKGLGNKTGENEKKEWAYSGHVLRAMQGFLI